MRDSPDDMNRLARVVVFEDEYTRPFRIFRVVFDDHGGRDSVHDIGDEHVVCCQLFVPMSGNLHFAARHERLYGVQGLAQLLTPSLAVFAGFRALGRHRNTRRLAFPLKKDLRCYALSASIARTEAQALQTTGQNAVR
jgi:hypothetical protein